MTITYAAIRDILDFIIEDPDLLSLVTSADGSTDNDTLVDVTLERYKDGRFKGYYTWLTAAAEERLIENSTKLGGRLQFFEAATAQVKTSISYKLWNYSNAMKLSQINRAIRYCFPRFYNPVANETLFGQNSYGESPDEFNKFIYTIPSGFDGYPQEIWLLHALIGTHSGDDAAAVLTDLGATWVSSEFVGLTLYNKTDGSSGTVTSNTSTTITCTLAGGTDNAWDGDDEYIIQHPGFEPERLKHYTILDPAGSTKRFRADINEDNLIVLIGKGRLTEFTTEASTTELTTPQAEVLMQKAAANIFQLMADRVDSKDRSKFTEMHIIAEGRYEGKSKQDAMPSRAAPVVDYRWTIGRET